MGQPHKNSNVPTIKHNMNLSSQQLIKEIEVLLPTQESLEEEDGRSGRLNFFCLPTAAGRGGEEWTEAAIFNPCIQFCMSLSLKKVNTHINEFSICKKNLAFKMVLNDTCAVKKN